MADRHIKVCGLCDAAAVDAAVLAGATMVGFVFVPASPRAICPDAAADLVSRIRPEVLSVGLFAEGTVDEIVAAARRAGVGAIQWHPRSPVPEMAIALRAAWDGPLIVAHPIATPADVAATVPSGADFMLLDAKPPLGATIGGGHGDTYDWSILEAYAAPAPFLLAGGLDVANVRRAITAVGHQPSFGGVDVSSGVEKSRGVKDPARIAEFVAAAQAAFARQVA